MSTAEQIETERNALIKLIKDSQARNLLLKMALMEEDLIIIGYLTHSKFYWVSPSWTSLLGYSFKELTQTDFFEFIHPEDIENSRYAFEHLRSEGQ